MRLMEHLSAECDATESYFRRHLLAEDMARLARAADLARRADQASDLAKAALMIGWTPGDTRTHELIHALEPMLMALWSAVRLPSAETEHRLLETWRAFEQLRMDRLVGCLARVPAPLSGVDLCGAA